jgi:hypothetical protein
MTGIQALERKAATKPMRPGLIERVEHEYIRHGTLSLIANFEVATGKLVSPSIGPTRNEADFARHIETTINTAPQAEWVFIVDQLNTHQSESLVRIVAGNCQIDDDLGIKGKAGILKSMATRRDFLSCMYSDTIILIIRASESRKAIKQIDCLYLPDCLIARVPFMFKENIGLILSRYLQVIGFDSSTSPNTPRG